MNYIFGFNVIRCFTSSDNDELFSLTVDLLRNLVNYYRNSINTSVFVQNK